MIGKCGRLNDEECGTLPPVSSRCPKLEIEEEDNREMEGAEG